MGWQDDPIAAPGAPAADLQPWEKDAVVYKAPGAKIASGIGEAIQAGYQSSAPGLALRGKLPDVQLDPTHSTWYERLAAGATQLASEFPLMVAGGVSGGAAGTVAGPVGTLVGGGAGAFAVPAAIREAYTQAYSKGEITSSADFLNRAAIVLKQTGKEAVVGAATAGAGKLAGLGAATAGLGAKATGAAVLGAEGGTLVVTPALMEGRLPEPQDFTDAAILLVGLKGVGAASRKLSDIYAKTGKTPTEVLADARTDPTIIEDLQAGTPAKIVKPINAAEVQSALKAGDEAGAQNALDAKLRALGTQTKTVNDKDGNPITLEFKDTNPDGAQPWYIVEAKDADGNVIGSANPGFDVRPGRTMSDVEVQEAYRRKGVATAMYDFAEEVSGIKLSKSGVASADATAFWESRNARAAEPAPKTEPAYDPEAKVSVQAFDAESGAMAETSMTAREALDDNSKRRDQMEGLLKCLGA